MQILRGIPVSPGVAISRVVVLDAEDFPIPKRVVGAGQVPQQQQRLTEALEASADEIEKLREQTQSQLGAELSKIFSFHSGMLADPQMVEQFRSVIEQQHVTAEYAVYSVMRKLAKMFTQQSNRYFRERVSDVWDLERRILRHLIGQLKDELDQLDQPAIIVAHDLTPSQTAGLNKDKIKGIATDAGGRTSHTAILAHALGIPAVVGLEHITDKLTSGDTIIVDGNRGAAIVEPDAAQLMEYRAEVRRLAAVEDTLSELREKPAITKDGTEIELLANIEFPTEIAAALERGAVGIGLYRTEFLFLASETAPTEDEQYEAYTQAIKALDGRKLTIRTLDLGADKIWSGDTQTPMERNPFLGCRSIRLCLQNLELFKTQLRAILRASAEGPLQIMFPMISNIMELRQAKMILQDVREDLEEQGVAVRSDIPVGIMIEVPSAALRSASLMREVDFFSIGTNDLVQYTVAVDRGNERIASLYSSAHPAVLQLVRDVIRTANRAKFPVSLCGEMAGETDFVMLLLGLGLRQFSMTPPALPEVKKVIRSVTIEQCQKLARRAASFESDRQVMNFLRDELVKVIPEVLDGRSVEV